MCCIILHKSKILKKFINHFTQRTNFIYLLFSFLLFFYTLNSLTTSCRHYSAIILSKYINVCDKSLIRLTIIPTLTAIPRPQYVLGTISPNPTLRNVIAISHIEFKRFACSSSWNLCANIIHVYEFGVFCNL